MNCTECGFHLWSKEAERRGAHPECQDEEQPHVMDLEDQLEEALSIRSVAPKASREGV